jgi:Uroporphyrinogen decarboxylase (URO-D).
MEVKPIRLAWKGTQTSRQRFYNQMHYKPHDRCFNMEFGYWDENFSKWNMFTENNIHSNIEADVFFNFDPIFDVTGNLWMSPPFESKIIKETKDTNIIINGDGLLAEVAKDRHGTIPHYIKSSIETPDDWKKVKKERFRVDDPNRALDIEALKKRHPSDRTYPLGVNAGSMIGRVRDMLTFEGLCYALYDYPEMVEDMVETSCILVEETLDQLLPHFQFDYASGWEDICFKNGPIVPPKFFKEVVMPRYKRINAKLKKYGIDIWYIDCDGDVRPILPYMMEGGINCLFPFEVNGCAHPAELLQEYGKDLRIMGGIDKMQLKAGKDEIKRYLESVAPLVERGGYIPFCDHRCPPDVTEENYLYYLDLKEEMFGMK